MKIFSSYFSTKKTLQRSISANREGDYQKALEILMPVFGSKELISRSRIWKSTWTIVGEVFQQFGEEKLASLSTKISFKQDHPDQFFRLGYDLVDKGMGEIALPVLARGALLFPNNERILTELAHIFEESKLYKEAKQSLLQSPNLVQTSFMPRYLIVFYSIMMGDLEEANKWFSGLDKLLTSVPFEFMKNYTFMFENIKAMIDRAQLLTPHTSLNSYDLLGWNAVVNGNIVLHLSEYGLESMGGRYAFYQESPGRLFSCVNQLKRVLSTLSMSPQRILALPDRDSCILAHFAAQFFDCSIEIFSEKTKSLPGLIICYSSDLITHEIFDLLSEAQEDQIFWCHASNWTQSSIAPDFISYFAQCACPPWGKQISLDLEAFEGKEIGILNEKPNFVTKEPLEGTYQEIAGSLCKMIDAQEVEDNNAVKILAQVLFCDENDKEKNMFNRVRDRSRQWVDSPVSSEAFPWKAD